MHLTWEYSQRLADLDIITEFLVQVSLHYKHTKFSSDAVVSLDFILHFYITAITALSVELQFLSASPVLLNFCPSNS